jgi:hypothetical protein
MKDCRTFLKLQEAIGFKQAKAKNQGYKGVMSTNASILVDSVGPPSAEVCSTAASFP